MGIQVQSLSKYYGRQKAVDSISFEAKPGRILGFLGPNGAGKSTTMKMLTGYLRPSEGQVFIDGLEVNARQLEVKRRIGYLPEHTPLYMDMYVKEFLHFVGSAYQLANLDKRVDEVVEQVGLGDERKKKITMLSKGYRQRVGLAQAIIHQPQVLILDEPTSGLDPNQLIEVRELIRNLGKDKTVVLSTHIMQEVETICDEVVILNRGKIVADSSLDDLKKIHGSLSLEAIFSKLTP